MFAPHTGEAETMTGEATTEADDGTPLKVTFEATGHLERDVNIVQRTSASRPVVTPTGTVWELAEVNGPAKNATND